MSEFGRVGRGYGWSVYGLYVFGVGLIFVFIRFFYSVRLSAGSVAW